MKYFIRIIIPLLALLLVVCDEMSVTFCINTFGNEVETGGTKVFCWDVNGNSACDTCVAKDFNNQIIKGYSHNDYIGKRVYEICQAKINGTSIGPIDTTDTTNNMDNLVFLQDGALTKYGFDDWKDFGSSAPDQSSYLSLKAGDSTGFVIVNRYNSNTYGRYFLKIEFDITSSLSFEKNSFRDTITIQPASNTKVTLYSRNATAEVEKAEINVYGEEIGQFPVQLSGKTSIADDYLKVITYEEKVEPEIRFYRVNSPLAFTNDVTKVKSEFNRYLKQAVASVDTVFMDPFAGTDWDGNSNNNLDMFSSSLNISADRLEFEKLISDIESQYGSLQSCLEVVSSDGLPKIAVISSKITLNWQVEEDIDSGAVSVKLNDVEGLEIDQLLRIQTWDGQDHEWRTIVTKHYSPPGVTFDEPLEKPHFKGDVLYDDREIHPGGVILANTNCACLPDKSTFMAFVHEYLHMNTNRFHPHTENDTTNIMYRKSHSNRGTLRFRVLDTDFGPSVQQWEKIHE